MHTDDLCSILLRARNIDIVRCIDLGRKKTTKHTSHRDNEMSKQMNGYVQCRVGWVRFFKY